MLNTKKSSIVDESNHNDAEQESLSIDATIKHHPFSGLVDLAGELLHTPYQKMVCMDGNNLYSEKE